MDTIKEAMKKFVGKGPDSSTNIDPSELAKQVNQYIKTLENYIKELDGKCRLGNIYSIL